MIDLKDEILEATNSDQRYLQIRGVLQHDELQHKFKYFKLKEDGVLVY